MTTIIRQPTFSGTGQRIGASYFAGEVELHLPAQGRPEVYLDMETVDVGVLVTVLPELITLFNDPTVRAAILHACAGK